MLKSTIQLNILLMLVMASPLWAGRCQLRLHDSITVDAGTVITLADVATINGENEQLRTSLGRVAVGEAIDETLFVGAFEINRALRQSGINPAQIDLFGALHCIVKIKANDLQNPKSVAASRAVLAPGQRVYTIADELKNQVVLSTQLQADRIVLQFNALHSELLEEIYSPQRFVIRPVAAVTLGMVRFDITDTEKEITLNIVGTARYITRSLAARYALRAGDILREDNTHFVERSITRLSDAGVEDADILLGFELVQSVRAGQGLSPSMVRRMTVVKRNDIIDVMVQAGSVMVTKKGIAQNDGAKGDIITVRVQYNNSNDRNSRNRAIDQNLSARVIGPGQVALGNQKHSSSMAFADRKEQR